MPSVCFYFQVHQPYRLKPFSYFDSSVELDYFDEEQNRAIMQKVAEKCYLPANQLMLELIRKHQGAFRIAYSITGVALEQMEKYTPRVIESFQALAETGCIEFLGETYYHSLAALYDRTEFVAQLEQHANLTRELFGMSPQVLRNTELIYSDEIGKLAAQLGYRGILAEGVDEILFLQSPHHIYAVPEKDCGLLLKSYKLSDDIAFRFSDRSWQEWPLTTKKFSSWIEALGEDADTLNLFMDYETFGEHQWAESGIFDFLRALPQEVLSLRDWNFRTPSEVLLTYPKRGELSVPRLTSWADKDRGVSAWCGNQMQERALQMAYEVAHTLRKEGDTDAYSTWRKLLTSDHFYYMSTKKASDGEVHSYFSPFESPYDAFVSFMNVLRDFRQQLSRRASSMSSAVEVEVTPAKPYRPSIPALGQRPRLRAR